MELENSVLSRWLWILSEAIEAAERVQADQALIAGGVIALREAVRSPARVAVGVASSSRDDLAVFDQLSLARTWFPKSSRPFRTASLSGPGGAITRREIPRSS